MTVEWATCGRCNGASFCANRGDSAGWRCACCLSHENADLRALVAQYVAGRRANREHAARVQEDLRNARTHIAMIETRLEKLEKVRKLP